MHHYLHDKARNVLSIINGKVPLYSAMSMTLSFRNWVDLWYWPFFSYMRFFKLYFNHSNIENASKMFCDIFKMQCRIFSLTYAIQKIHAFTCTLHVRLVVFFIHDDFTQWIKMNMTLLSQVYIFTRLIS